MHKLVFVHELNNYSGSPKVLSIVLSGLTARGYQTELITSRSRGFLSDIRGVKYRYNAYRWQKHKAFTAFFLLISQLRVFFMVLCGPRRDTLYYLNTGTNSSAALACRLSGKHFIYHIHEDLTQRKALYALHRLTYRLCRARTIFVSRYLQEKMGGRNDSVVIYNALDDAYMHQAHTAQKMQREKSTVLMVAALRRYKGVYEFIELAKKFPRFDFELVLSAGQPEVDALISQTNSAALRNLKVFPLQVNLHPFYRRTKLLLQLSHPKQWVETFGLTILEAMSYGVPAIVPDAGGPAELIKDGYNGYTCDPLDMDRLASLTASVMSDEKLYARLSANALQESMKYSEKLMVDAIEKYITQS